MVFGLVKLGTETREHFKSRRELIMKELATSEQQAAGAERDEVIAAAREIMSLQKYCALITVDAAGQPQVRTMNPFPPEADLTVWLATNSRCRKVQEIQQHSQVSLYYADHQEASGYVVLTGRAVLVDEMSEKLKRKRDYWEQAFPDWTYLLLIKVIPENLEVLNYNRGFLNDTVTWQIPAIELKNPGAV
jgi:general stress protein 26